MKPPIKTFPALEQKAQGCASGSIVCTMQYYRSNSLRTTATALRPTSLPCIRPKGCGPVQRVRGRSVGCSFASSQKALSCAKISS